MTPFFYPTIIALLLAWTVVARADTVPAFVPPEIYRTIHFEEYGGGPMRKYVDGFLEEVRLHQVLKKRYRIETVDARDWTRGYSAAYNQAMRQAAENRFGSVWWVDSLQEAGIDLTEDPHFATYRLKDGRLEFEWHKGDGPRRQWKVSSAQLESLRAVIESVHREAWSGIYWTLVLDGGAVFCTIKMGDFNSQFEGSNAAPPCFAELLETMDAIAGEEVGSFWEMPPGLHFESHQAMSEIGSEEIERMLQESDGRFHPIRQRSP